jgi:hypothetical protein
VTCVFSHASLVHRYYTPKTGQFLSVDPALAKSGQPYAFVDDDPLNNSDPLGLLLDDGNGGTAGYTYKTHENVCITGCGGSSGPGSEACGKCTATATVNKSTDTNPQITVTGNIQVSSSQPIQGAPKVSFDGHGLTVSVQNVPISIPKATLLSVSQKFGVCKQVTDGYVFVMSCALSTPLGSSGPISATATLTVTTTTRSNDTEGDLTAGGAVSVTLATAGASAALSFAKSVVSTTEKDCSEDPETCVLALFGGT